MVRTRLTGSVCFMYGEQHLFIGVLFVLFGLCHLKFSKKVSTVILVGIW